MSWSAFAGLALTVGGIAGILTQTPVGSLPCDSMRARVGVAAQWAGHARGEILMQSALQLKSPWSK
jgi:hypothetical protein